MPKNWYEVEVGGEWVEIEADSPEHAAELSKKLPMSKATEGMLAQSRADDPSPYKRGVLDQVMEPVSEYMSGIGAGLVETGQGMAALPSAIYHDPVGVAKGAIPAMWDEAKETVSDVLSGDPRRMGRATPGIAASAFPATRVGRAALRPVGKAMKTKPVALAMEKAGSQGGVWSMLNSMRGGIADKLDPPRLVKGYDRYSSNRPASSTRTAPASSTRPTTVMDDVETFMPNTPASSTATAVDAVADPVTSSVIDRFMANSPSSTPARVSVSRTDRMPSQRVPGSLDKETEAVMREFLERSTHGVAGFRNTPTLSKAELARLKDAMDKIMKRRGEQ